MIGASSITLLALLTPLLLQHSTSQLLLERDAPINVQLNIDGLHICSEKDYKQCIVSWNPDHDECYDVFPNFKIQSIVVPDRASCEIYQYISCTEYRNTLNPNMYQTYTGEAQSDVTKNWHGNVVKSLKCKKMDALPSAPTLPTATKMDNTPDPKGCIPDGYHPWDCVLIPEYAKDVIERMNVLPS